MRETKIHEKFWSQYLKEREHSEDLGVDVKMILRWILNK